MAMRLGETASVKDNLISLHAAFGNTETAESISWLFESVSCYASRVEELFSQAVELGALERKQQQILTSVFYEGLEIDLKVASVHKYETIDNHNAFKAEIRKLETILSKTKTATSPGKGQIPCQQVTRQDNLEFREIKYMLKKLNERMDKMEKQSNSKSTPLENNANKVSDRTYSYRPQNGSSYSYRLQSDSSYSYRPQGQFREHS